MAPRQPKSPAESVVRLSIVATRELAEELAKFAAAERRSVSNAATVLIERALADARRAG